MSKHIHICTLYTYTYTHIYTHICTNALVYIHIIFPDHLKVTFSHCDSWYCGVYQLTRSPPFVMRNAGALKRGNRLLVQSPSTPGLSVDAASGVSCLRHLPAAGPSAGSSAFSFTRSQSSSRQLLSKHAGLWKLFLFQVITWRNYTLSHLNLPFTKSLWKFP